MSISLQRSPRFDVDTAENGLPKDTYIPPPPIHPDSPAEQNVANGRDHEEQDGKPGARPENRVEPVRPLLRPTEEKAMNKRINE